MENEPSPPLQSIEKEMDDILERLYRSTDKKGGLSPSRSFATKWLGDVRKLFPSSIVRIMQKDAIEKFGIKKLLSNPSFLENVVPDIQLVAAFLSVKESLPPESYIKAKQYIDLLASQIEEKLKMTLVDRISGLKDKQKITYQAQ